MRLLITGASGTIGVRLAADLALGESGADATVIMATGHWRSIRAAARCTKPGLGAVTQATELLNPLQRSH